MEKTLFSLALLLIAAKAGGLISSKLKMPEVLGSLLAGVVLGPMALNLVQYDDISLLSNLGVIFLMFLAGLETDAGQFKQAGKSAFVIAVMGIALPLALGTAGAFLFFSSPMENLFIGTILTATSVSITVETLAELGKLNTRPGINILGAAVIDDVLGLVLISVLLGLNGNAGGGSFAAKMAGIAVFCLVGIAAVVFLPGVIEKFTADMQPGRALLTFSIALALLAAGLAERVGIAAITGAYLFGLLLSQLSQKEYLVRNVKAISSGFLAPIFFAGVGLEAKMDGSDLNVLLITLVMFFVAVVGKVAGCGAAARLFRMSRAESLQIGTGMISRGEVAIITANIGLQNRIITQEVFIPTILVVLLTTVATPILLKLSFSHRFEQRLREKRP